MSDFKRVTGRRPAALNQFHELSPLAATYIVAVAALAGFATYLGSAAGVGTAEYVGLTVGLAVAATIAQLSEVRTANNKAYVATISFFMAASILLPPLDMAMTVAIVFLAEFIVKKKKLYIVIFNIGSNVLCTLAAYAAFNAITGTSGVTPLTDGVMPTAGALAAVAVYLLVNHATLTLVLRLARGVPVRDTGLFRRDSVVTDLGLLALGVVIAGLWSLGPPLVAFVAIPLVLLQRALHFPMLRQASRTDPKTGLANAAWFLEQADHELQRAVRLETTLSVLVADLDLLRNINNAYGHLAGDVVLKGVADVLRNEVRTYDVPSRFGGEEFAVLLPAADVEEALALAERIRNRVSRERFAIPTSVQPITATVSVGVATLGEHGTTIKELLHAADLALYRAKVEGRDRVRVASPDDDEQVPPGAVAALQQEKPVAPVQKLFTDAPSRLAASLPVPPVTIPRARVDAEHVAEVTARAAAATAEAPAAAPAPERPTAPRRPARPTWPVTVMVTLAAIMASAVVIYSQPQLSTAAVIFPLLALLAETLREDVYGTSTISLSAVPVLGAVAAGRPIAAIVAAACCGIASSYSGGMRRRVEPYLFNTATFVFSASIASAIRLVVSTHTPMRTALLILVMEAAALAYFIVDNGLVAQIIARDTGRTTPEVFRRDFAWLAPHFAAYGLLGALLGAAWEAFGVWGLAVFLLPVALMRVSQRQYLAKTTGHVTELRRLADDLSASKTEVEQINSALAVALHTVSDAHKATATALAGAIDARDAITGGHIERVSALGIALCEVVDPALAADPQVAFGFLLHDVGKIGVPDSVLLKPGPLDLKEVEIMRNHPEIGERLVTAAGFAPVAREIVITHHERWDGQGYPRGLRGTEIPLCSRLFSIADAMDAMVSDRPYRKGMPLDEAIAEVQRHSGTQFDPMAVEAMLTLDEQRLIELLRLDGRDRQPSGQPTPRQLRVVGG
ncbi:MAG TPA: diguanylate cyclase [Mycobacteriales bacterium]|nr:diguanylate cyclase [Mycobacteriales bacterium]